MAKYTVAVAVAQTMPKSAIEAVAKQLGSSWQSRAAFAGTGFAVQKFDNRGRAVGHWAIDLDGNVTYSATR